MENPVFKKYCYWMDKEALEALKSMFKKEGTEIYCAQRVPCELFRVEIGYSAPEVWNEFPKETAEKLAQWFKNVVGVDEPLEEIFEVWSAVHSNFLEGRFSVKEGTNTIPYTIADTNHTSSCCIELFNIVGKEFKAKYVKPCLGAKIAKALEADIYYRVENLKGIK